MSHDQPPARIIHRHPRVLDGSDRHDSVPVSGVNMTTPQQELLNTLTESEWSVLWVGTLLHTPISMIVWERQPLAAIEKVIQEIRKLEGANK